MNEPPVTRMTSSDTASAEVLIRNEKADELPYVVLFTTPIIEAYRNTIEFPFTNVLDGLQNFSGLPGAVTSS